MNEVKTNLEYGDIVEVIATGERLLVTEIFIPELAPDENADDFACWIECSPLEVDNSTTCDYYDYPEFDLRKVGRLSQEEADYRHEKARLDNA